MKKTKKRKRVVIYANRCEYEQFPSRDRVCIRNAFEKCYDDGRVLVDMYQDESTDGSGRRPGLKRLLRDAGAGMFDEVWVPNGLPLADTLSSHERIELWLWCAGVDVEYPYGQGPEAYFAFRTLWERREARRRMKMACGNKTETEPQPA